MALVPPGKFSSQLSVHRPANLAAKTAEKNGLPYQSLVNEILAGEMRKLS